MIWILSISVIWLEIAKISMKYARACSLGTGGLIVKVPGSQEISSSILKIDISMA